MASLTMKGISRSCWFRNMESASSEETVPWPLEHLVRNKGLRLRLELWKKEEEVVNQRIERKQLRFNNTKNEIYQLLGLYFVFQGVILTALAQANHLSTNNWWIPFILSVLASVSTILALWYKLGDCGLLQSHIREEKKHSKALYRAIETLITSGAAYDPNDFSKLPVCDEAGAAAPNSNKDESLVRKLWESHMKEYGAALIFIVVVFSSIMAVSCRIILDSEACYE